MLISLLVIINDFYGSFAIQINNMLKVANEDNPVVKEFQVLLLIAHYYSMRAACLSQKSLVSRNNIDIDKSISRVLA